MYWTPTEPLLGLYWATTGSLLGLDWASSGTGPLYGASTGPLLGCLLDLDWASTGPRLDLQPDPYLTYAGPLLDGEWTIPF